MSVRNLQLNSCLKLILLFFFCSDSCESSFVMAERELCDISFHCLKFLKIRLVNSNFLVRFERRNPLFAYICLAKNKQRS